ncbi:MAG: excinuclease ABC subunit UvrA [Gammaproteobacteria bacterium]|jgi:excinuclease ABC subunit A|nr:excinuclease ABC subunit UvrA [Gammaproteobacteria bacterium]MBT4608365.1 excinuclease ABC subunit UvrA [Thiotrichales bacterium]MBT3471725.1 excinuclease ABC subunit UvrA [Gammaproteobacteria bacterium]MBT3967333.1 excinuclease ABC subunit UvrA [Gammaproteobacteria bacterium]MBT4080592.1 excinuclease ABC subunit UvrA [Gammaproteobacteria bacterium]
MDKILVRGARTHNLKNINLELPRDKLIVITGLSGSGKSSLAFDTIYAEGQRRYVESLSAYARQFLSLMEKPDVDHIEGLSPAISIEQKSTSHNPRSTVGTVTEIHDYLRLLYARVGTPHCPEHDTILEAQPISQMVDQILELPKGSKILLLAPLIRGRKGEHIQLLEEQRASGYLRVRIDGALYELDSLPKIDGRRKHTIEIVVDRLKVRPDIRQRLAESLETAITLSDGLASVAAMECPESDLLNFSARFSCTECGYSLDELEPRLFSFNNPAGACSSCEGLGVQQYPDPARVVNDKTLSLADGAIKNWDRRNNWIYQTLNSLSTHYQFDLEMPFEQLPETIQQTILYGSGEEVIPFTFSNSKGEITRKEHPFEGIIPNMERRYRDSESNRVREELSKFLNSRPCPSCNGSRLREEARHIFIDERPLHQISSLAIGEAAQFFETLTLPGWRGEVATKIIKEISERLGFLVNVGLNYLSLERSADTLSGGEAQRIRLASQIGAGLVGVMYVLDEPSIGLHQRDNQRLLDTLLRLRDMGNTVIVVEHDEDAIQSADYVVDIGPGAGTHGGQIVAEGTPKQVLSNPQSLTGQYLSGVRSIAIPATRTPIDPKKQLVIRGASGNNLRGVSVEIPSGLMICVTGVSGSGKSTLINDTLYRATAQFLNRAKEAPAPYESIEGLSLFDKVVNINQSPIGRTPRSNPATYTGLFSPMRELFSGTEEARARGYTPGRFSFNVKGGRCEACQGDGVIRVEMHFLADVYVPCDVCKGKRYNRETLEVLYKGKSINDVLEMTVEEARTFFDPVPTIAKKLQTLMDVGLSYIRLGQNATTLSGGEAQRIKLSRELSKRDTGKTLYILDEPTTGLHFHDIEQLLQVLHRLRDHGNTVVVIEHNLDVIKTADWLIDLGPEGGAGGGEIIATGTPERIAADSASYTGHYLKAHLS